jgi:large subunit ribosomal protein L18
MQYKLRKLRTKAKINKTDRNILIVSKSNKNLFVQIVDSITRKCKIGFSTSTISGSSTKTQKAEKAGEIVAELLKKENITDITLDRNGYVYKGRVLAFSESLRKSGINI